MAYHVVDPEQLEPTEDHPCDRRGVSEVADLATVAAAVYRLQPGEELSQHYHYHDEREELVSVLEGTLTVETPEGGYDVPAGSVFVVEPGSPIRPYNPADADRPVRVFGVGAPRYDIGRRYDPESDAPPGN
jgi:uncharacterized cupin superfamily protein